MSRPSPIATSLLAALLAALALLLAPLDAQAQDDDALQSEEPEEPEEPVNPCLGQPDAPFPDDKNRLELTACELWRSEGPCRGKTPQPIDRDKPLATMSECNLWRLGFQWEGYKSHGPSLTAGLVAAGPGLVFNGLGHLYQGNRWIGWRLLATEGLGLGLIGAGFLTIAAVDESGVFDDIANLGVQLGGALISTAYMMDVIGSSKGTEAQLPVPIDILEGTRPRLRMHTLFSDEFNCSPTSPCNFLELDVEADLGFFVLKARTLQHVLQSYAEYTVAAGLKLQQGREPSDYLAAFVTIERPSWDRNEFVLLPSGAEATGGLRVEVTVDLSLEMSQLLESLENVVNVLTVGIGFPGDVGYRAAVPGNRSRPYLIVEQTVLIGLTPKLMLRPRYIFSEAELVGPIARNIGAFATDLVWNPWRDLALEAGVLVGSGEQVTLGTSYEF